MHQVRQFFSKNKERMGLSSPASFVMALIVGFICLIDTSSVLAADVATGQELMKQFPVAYVFTFLFLMLGPFKIIGPFAMITKGADVALTRKIALQAILFSSIALLVAAFIGEFILTRYGIPLPILALAGGIILFLVALHNTLKQFELPTSHSEVDANPTQTPTVKQALTPLAFPTIVTPYGIAATIVFLAFSPDLQGRLAIGVAVLVIMLLNFIVMINVRHIGPVWSITLAILGAVISVIQVALGLQIINNSLRALGVL